LSSPLECVEGGLHDTRGQGKKNIDALLVAEGLQVFNMADLMPTRIGTEAKRHLFIVREVETKAEVDRSIKRLKKLWQSTLAKGFLG